jgi:hypothetical protein
VFSLGGRESILEDVTISELNLAEEKKRPYELLFKAMITELMEVVTGEMKFSQDFFLYDMDQALCGSIFGKVVSLYSVNIEFMIDSNLFRIIFGSIVNKVMISLEC